MHYFIDGYNLLFRVLKSGDNLKSKREEITKNLETKIDILKLDCTLVFDSHYQEDDSTRSHYKSLEIVFTATGQTADEYILTELKQSKNPTEHTVITSDKILARLCRMRLSKTESVEEFLCWLNKRYKNKITSTAIENTEHLNTITERILKPLIPLKNEPPAKKPLKEKHLLINSETPIPLRRMEGDDFNYYLSTFEAQSNTQEEEKQKNKKQNKPHKKLPPCNPPLKTDRFISDRERWQELFEKKT